MPAPGHICKEQGDCQHSTEIGWLSKGKNYIYFLDYQTFVSELCPAILYEWAIKSITDSIVVKAFFFFLIFRFLYGGALG